MFKHILPPSFLLLIVLITTTSSLANSAFEVNLHIKEHKFYPDIIEVPTKKKIILYVYNDDKSIEEFESHDLKREKIILGGSYAKIILPPLKEGRYKFFGDFHQEIAKGEIIVKSND